MIAIELNKLILVAHQSESGDAIKITVQGSDPEKSGQAATTVPQSFLARIKNYCNGR